MSESNYLINFPMIITNPARKPISDEASVGLGIVAAMVKTPLVVLSSNPKPIPVVFPIFINSFINTIIVLEEEEEEEEERFSSHVRKKYWFDEGEEDTTCVINGVIFEPTSPPPLTPRMEDFGDFLSCCYLCTKSLHGIDVFMYRGEKAFCSDECRNQQITRDKYQRTAGKINDR